MRNLADAALDVAKELGGAVVIVFVAYGSRGAAGAVLAVTGLGLWFLLSRWRWPYKPCSSCKATGRNSGSSRKRHGDCKRCDGTRRVKRPGARVVHRVLLSTRSQLRNRREK